MTNADGEIVIQQDYTPFGENLAGLGVRDVGTNVSYTGQLRMGIGLQYYKARYYDPEIGRFTREDTYKDSLMMPQSQNRYSYVLNNRVPRIRHS